MCSTRIWHNRLLLRTVWCVDRQLQPAISLQNVLENVVGDVAALQALSEKTGKEVGFSFLRAAGSHPGGRRFESG
jgi:hypothetical protein